MKRESLRWLLLAMGSVAFCSNLEMSWAAVSNCSLLGTFDASTQSCICDLGWKGADCSQVDLLSKPEAPESYLDGVYDPAYPTWGGSIIESDLRGNDCGPATAKDRKYYWLGSTMGNSAGLSCWSSTSACGIWESYNPKGPWTFKSWVGWGNYSNSSHRQTFLPTDIPWCHNFRAIVESKLSDSNDINSSKSYAIAAYAILKQDKKSGLYSNAVLAAPNSSFCGGYAYPFPRSTKNQILHVGYREIPSNACASERYQVALGIRNILDPRTLISNLNSSGRSEYVNTELAWLNIRALIPNLGSVFPANPSPLVSNLTNQNSLVKYKGAAAKPAVPAIQTGQYYRPLSFRVATKGEHLGIVAVRADHFIWDSGVRYYMPALVGPSTWNMEDPFFFETKNAYHFIVHDQAQCGTAKLTCGSSAHLSKQALDMIDNGAYKNWTLSKPIYGNSFPGLVDKAVWRQRPYLWFNTNPQSDSYGGPAFLFTGTIWNGRFDNASDSWISKHGPTKNYASPTKAASSL